MKAWYLEIKDSDEGRYVVFANTRNEARVQADSKDLMYDRWIDIIAYRAPKYDGLEKLTQRELDKVLWRDGWEWLDFSCPAPEETTDEQFYEWYDTIFQPTPQGDNE
jgi:hypothetical protein